MKEVPAVALGSVGITALLLTALFLLGQPPGGPSQDAVRAGEADKAQPAGTGKGSGRGGTKI